jgi:hypothetical protein
MGPVKEGQSPRPLTRTSPSNAHGNWIHIVHTAPAPRANSLILP